MWSRRKLKHDAKKSIKQNYIAMIAVCFIVAIFAGEYGSTTSIIYEYNADRAITENGIDYIEKRTNSEAVEDLINNIVDFDGGMTISDNNIKQMIFNQYTRSKEYMFKFVHSINGFMSHETSKAVIFLVMGLMGFLFSMFVANPLVVGEKRFFIESRKYSKTKISRMAFLYTGKNLINPVWVMFTRGLFFFLWALTIIGGFIKYYEYKMIPYILAENPKTDRKKAFILSKEMMRGNKWDAFVLDLSFMGWIFLQMITFGVLAVLFVNPYYSATNAELYMTLRQYAIEGKYQYYEELNDIYL